MKFKEFGLTSWAINNRTSVYVISIIVTLFGMMTYNSIQKEKFPDIVIPTIFVATIYPGNSPADMEKLVTRNIEKQVKSIAGVKKITSNSVQDFSTVTIEFNASMKVADAKQKVKDAVDRAKADLPKDLLKEPDVMEMDFAEMPIMYVNLSANYDLNKLKKYADKLQDKIEGLKEITRVDIVGAPEREVVVNLDMYKMQAAKITFRDVESAIQMENMSMSGGNMQMGNMKVPISIDGQIKDPSEIENIIVRNSVGAPIKIIELLSDSIKLQDKERESFARLDHKNVITLNVIKRSGENLIAASDKIRDIVAESQKNDFPKDLVVKLTGDQSSQTRSTLNDLINTIIIGFILVTVILMFFMGTTNAIFVGLSVPLSIFIAFLVLPGVGFTLNMIVLFSFLLAIGIVVDDAIVVIENTHRIYHSTSLSIIKAAKYAAGEVFVPVLAGTLTTLAPFVPLAFWPGIIGKFMFFLPITLIIVLIASLVVAFLINPVFAVSFMKREHGEGEVSGKKKGKGFRNSLIVMGILALLFYVGGNFGMGNFTLTIAILVVLNKYVFNRWIHTFQTRALPKFMNGYERLLRWMLYKRRPTYVLLSVVGLLILSIFLTIARAPKVVFFPSGDPNFVYCYVTLPVGTDVRVTDSVTKIIERKVYQIVGSGNPDVESIISNVAVGADDPRSGSRNVQSHKGKVTVAFKEFALRTGRPTIYYLDELRKKVKEEGIPGAQITAEPEQNGPPTGKAINIEISGADYKELAKLSVAVKKFIDKQNIPGIEDLRSDLIDRNPQIPIKIDRDRANREGISTATIGMEMRTANFGYESSKYKLDEDEYPINVRLGKESRSNINQLRDMKISYRDMASGQFRQIPLSAVAKDTFDYTLGGIKRINLKRVVTLQSNVLSTSNPTEVNAQIQQALVGYKAPDGYEIKMTGEQEEQKETGSFLGLALMLSLGLIFFILVTQFNSISKPFIILTEILFSIIGVLLGFSIFNMPICIVMTGVGIVALAGIVVKNGILLVEFSDVMKERGEKTVNAIVHAGKTRLNPVILTATATMLGLVPLALGMNINFFTLFSHGNPDFYIGGESVVFWGPLAWTIIFGLSFATFLTLLVVPCMYLINYKLKIYLRRKKILKPKLVE